MAYYYATTLGYSYVHNAVSIKVRNRLFSSKRQKKCIWLLYSV